MLEVWYNSNVNVWRKYMGDMENVFKEKISEILDKYNEDNSIIKEKYEEKLAILQNGRDEGKISEQEFTKYSEILKNNLNSDIRELNARYKRSKNDVELQIYDLLEEKINKNISEKTTTLMEQIKTIDQSIRKIQDQMNIELQQLAVDRKSLESEFSSERNRLKGDLSSQNSDELKEDCAYIPTEAREKFIHYIQQYGAIPVKELDKLKIVTAKESISDVEFEKLESAENDEKIRLEEKYNIKLQDLRSKIKELEEQKKNKEIELEKAKLDYKKQIDNINQNKQKKKLVPEVK